jgi:hypothetical protein
MFRTHAGIALAVLLLLAGCGGDDAGEQAPTTNLNREPRVEGRWRIFYTPDGEERQQATWRIRPLCATGPCTFNITSSAGATYSFEYDETTQEWTGRDRQLMDCISNKGDTVLSKNAYVVRSQITLSPIAAVRAGKETLLTEMHGDRYDRSTLTEEGFTKGCRDAATVHGSIEAVRVDAPPGRQRPVGPSLEEELGG